MPRLDASKKTRPAPVISLADRLRGRGVRLALAVFAGSFAFLLVLDVFAPHEGLIGIPGSVLVTTIVVIAILAGPWPATLLALGDGALFALILRDHGVSIATAVVSTLFWLFVGIVAGRLTGRLRREVANREERLTESRERARVLSQDLNRILELAPRFHIETDVAGVGLEICSAARAAFSVDGASLYQVEGSSLRLLARDPLHSAFEFGRVFFLPDIQDEPLRRPAFLEEFPGGPGSGFLRDLATLGEQGLLWIPLGVGGASFYVLVLSYREPPPQPAPGFLAVAQRFADQAAAALSRAEALELHGRMEAGLYPRLPLNIPGISVDVRFRAREQLLTMGGDFFGIIGRPQGELAFVMGDVSGHGPDSASLGATLRASWRALALAGADLPTILEILDAVVVNDRRSELTFVTLLAGRIDPARTSLELANIAHPPPILISNEAEFLTADPVSPLGFRSAAEWPVSRVDLPPNWRLLLYTDGLFEGREAPGSKERFGLEWLVKRVREAKTLDGRFLETLLTEIQTAQGGPLLDDVVAMLLSPGSGVGSHSAEDGSYAPARA